MFQEDAALFQQTNASGKHYEWQLSEGQEWFMINNDHIIECNYCQPGAKGITIDTDMGSLRIDFDDMTISGAFANLAVRRVSCMPSNNQAEDIGWYYRDNSHWREYGVQGLSLSSQDIEQKFNVNPIGSFQFTFGSYTYQVDFSGMTQTNLSTHKQRKMRRRPKFNSVYVNHSLNTSQQSTSTIDQFQSATASANTSTGVTWEFMGNEGVWTEYQKPYSSLDSTDIENQYQRNPQGQLAFRAGCYSYNLYFNGMYQINNTYNTKRAIRRIYANESNSSSLCQACWQFKDMDGQWKTFVKGSGRGKCTISSQEIEVQYQQNTSGVIHYSSVRFSYQLDFTAMTQTNLSTGTRRQVRRV